MTNFPWSTTTTRLAAGIRARRRAARLGFERLEQRIALALTIAFDYSYDSSGFFTTNPQARTVLQEAGQILGSQLTSNLAAITPDPAAGDTWTATSFNPSNTSQSISISNPSIAADTVVVYVGASSGSYAGFGGPGGYSDSGSTDWQNLVAARGQAGALASPPTGFGPWGGSVWFNQNQSWDFSGTQGSNFLGVSLHELCHVLGVGTAGSWYTDVNPTTNVFTGANALAVYGGPVPLDTTETNSLDAHWALGTISDGHYALMTPDVGDYIMTPLDWAGLRDIGWTMGHLVFSVEPPAAIAPGDGFAMVVDVVDPTGQVVTTFSGQVALALVGGSGGVVLGGATTVTAQAGVASFTGLSVGQAGAGYTISATADGATSAVSTSFTVAPALSLVFTAEPPGPIVAGAPFGLSFQVDGSGSQVDSSYSGSATLAVGAVSWTIPVHAGLANASGLVLDAAGSGLVITASAAGAASATTSPFAVVPAAASKLVVTTAPPSIIVQGTAFTVAVTAEDPFGNAVTSFSQGLTFTLINLDHPGVAYDSASAVPANGVASLSLDANSVGSGFVVEMSDVPGTFTAQTSAFEVISELTSRLVVTTEPSAAVSFNGFVQFVVSAEDSSGNLTSYFNQAVTAELVNSSEPGAASVSATVIAVNGIASFSIPVNFGGVGLVFRLSSEQGQLTATTNPFSVVVGPGSGPPPNATFGQATATGVFKRKRLTAVDIAALFTVPRGAFPTGLVMVETIIRPHGRIRKPQVKILGERRLVDGQMEIAFKPNQVLKKPLMVVYAGDASDSPATVALPILTAKSLGPPPASGRQNHRTRLAVSSTFARRSIKP